MKTWERLRNSMVKEARSELLNGLELCSDSQRLMFRRAFSSVCKDISGPTIEDIVKCIPVDRLGRVMGVVYRTLKKNMMEVE